MQQRTFLTWFAVGHLANDWPIAALWLIVPTAGIAMELSPTEIGLLFTLINVGGALAYLPAGIVADHVADRGRLLVATFWWVAIGYGLAAAAPGYVALAVMLAVAGMGNAAWHPIATGVLTRRCSEQPAQALGIHAIGGSLAEVLAPVSVGLLLAHLDWRAALAVCVLPTLLLALCFPRVARAVPRVERTAVRGPDMAELLAMWRRRDGLRLVAMICLYNMALMALLSMIPLYLVAAHALTPAAAGFVFSALLLTGAVAQPFVGRLSDIAGRRPVLVAGNLTAGLAGAALVLQPPFAVMLAAMTVAVAALDSIRAAMLAAAVDRAGTREATTLGFAFALMDGVGALGALLAGISAGLSWPHMFALAAGLSLAAATLGYATDLSRPADTVRR